MECKSSNIVYKRSNNAYVPFEPIENLSKKRPSETKLDIEKMYEQSLELASHYKELMRENKQLKEEYQRVESIKHNRQNLIAAVEKIVEEKSKELNSKHSNNFSWLVFKLNNKIYDLKAKIQGKEKAIMDIMLSRESDMIRQKQTEIECLNEIADFAKKEGLVNQDIEFKEGAELSEIKEIVWMEQEIKEKETEIIESEKVYQQQEKEVRRLMQELAKKRAELKSIKEMEAQYHRAQELYKEEKRKKEQRIAGNKTYLEELQNQKNEEQKKLESLKKKYQIMETEESRAVLNLRNELEILKKEYEQVRKTRQETVIKFSQVKVPINCKKQVKRVTFEQIKLISGNLNYSLALRGVSHTEIGSYFSVENKEDYSIREVVQILRKFPFAMESESQALLLARYMIQDAGDGYFLEDMDTSQSASVIKSILTKLIGEVKIYSRERAQSLRADVGPILFKFGRLVQQSLQMKEGESVREAVKKSFVSKERMIEALQNTVVSLQSQSFVHEDLDFTIFYLFSWSKNLDKLEVKRLFTIVEEDINWPEDGLL